METKCNHCGKIVQPSDKFCSHCGGGIESAPVTVICPKCGFQNPENASFCQKCGASLTEKTAADNQKTGPKTFASTGNYSGKMVKGKTPKGWKIFRNAIIVLVLLGIIAIIIWFQVDPEAGTKLKNFAGGLLVMAIFIFFIYRSAKKGKGRRRSNDDYDWDHNDDNDFDNDSNDD